MKTETLLLIVIILLSAIWGWFQPDIFPVEKFGPLCFFTAGIGGYLIGYFGSKLRKYL